MSERVVGQTDCECPPSLCPHGGEMMTYVFWAVVDTTDAREQPDIGSYGDGTFERYRDAARACRDLNEQEAKR